MAQESSPSDEMRRTPTEYLQAGFADDSGELRPELAGVFALSTASTLLSAQASAQEVATTFEAVRQVLNARGDGAASQFEDALDEALDQVEQLLGIENNEALDEWLGRCTDFVNTPADLAHFMAHFQAVVRQHASLVAVTLGNQTGQRSD